MESPRRGSKKDTLNYVAACVRSAGEPEFRQRLRVENNTINVTNRLLSVIV